MSQKKVIEYKEEKRNRKENIKKQKRKSVISKAVACVAVIAVVGAIGFAVYKNANSGSDGTNAHTVDISSINDYMDTLNLNEAMVAADDESEETSKEALETESEKDSSSNFGNADKNAQ